MILQLLERTNFLFLLFLIRLMMPHNVLKKFINFMIQKQRHQILVFQILIVRTIKNICSGLLVYATLKTLKPTIVHFKAKAK